ncbi:MULTISPECIES: LuxR C-terminal-related transcriptional regulator [unclassified Streptomyces]|uniref:helix-turn-helix transcriptional regulator n=1 Tax=unclassified Streptomyces TaxID=2593676 RepID=UPI00381AD6D0
MPFSYTFYRSLDDLADGCGESRCEVCRIIAGSRTDWLEGHIGKALAGAAEAEKTVAARRGRCPSNSLAWSAELAIMLRDFPRARKLLQGESSETPGPEGSHPGGADPDCSRRHRYAVQLLQAYLAFTSGDVECAIALTLEGLNAAERCGTRTWHPLGHTLLAGAALRKVDLAMAMTYVTRIGEDALLGHPQNTPGQSAWVAALAYRAKDNLPAALRMITELAEPGPAGRELLLAQPGAAPWIVRFALQAKEPGLAARALRTAEGLAEANPRFPTVTAPVLHARALVERDPDGLRRAADAHVDPWAKASALEDVGTLMAAGAGRKFAARALDEASIHYMNSGSSYDCLRVKSKIREIGGFSIHQPRKEKPQVVFTQLTGTEYSVAKLVSQGMTNIQVARMLSLSRHTVAFHLRKVFRKLDVSSRVELACIWNKRSA